MPLAGKQVLITGASRGLGRALAREFARAGCDLVLLARDNSQLQSLAGELESEGVSVQYHPCDLSDPAQIRDVCQHLPSPDLLINNAGIGYYKPFLEHSLAEHDAILDVNVRGLIHLTQHLLPAMVERGQGHIINIASDLGFTPLANMAVYAASKFAVRGFTLSLAKEMRPKGIRVSLVNPGIIDTSFNNGDEGTMDKAGALQPAQLATLVFQVASQPGYQLVDEVTVHPMEQEY